MSGIFKGDDMGIYMIVSLLALWTGIHDPGELLKYIIFCSFLVLIFFYPLIFNKLFASPAITLPSPFFVFPGMAFVYIEGFSAAYWIQAWAVLALIPCLWGVSLTSCNQKELWLFYGILFIAGITSLFRSSAGIGILFACLVALVLQLGYAKKTFSYGLLAIFLYFSLSQGLNSLATDYRNSSLAKAGVTQLSPANHPFWHTAYIGLGWEYLMIPRQLEKMNPWGQKLFISYLGFGKPNPWGIKYKDEVAIKKVADILPEAGYLSDEYGNVLRQEYFRCLQEHPFYFIKSSLLKIVTCIGLSVWNVISYFTLVISFGVLAIGLWREKGIIPLWRGVLPQIKKLIPCFIILVPTGLIGVLQGLIAVPNTNYQLGLTASFYLAWVLLIIAFCRKIYERSPSSLNY